MTDLIRNRTRALPSVSVLAIILAGVGAMAATLVESSAAGAGHAGALVRSLGLVLPRAAMPTLENTDILGLLAVLLLLAVSVSVVLAALRGFDTTAGTDARTETEDSNTRASVL